MAIGFTGVQLAIFDLDDTLIDNREVDYQSFAIVGKARKFHVPSRRALHDYRNQGMRAEEIIRTLWGNQPPSILEQIKKERLELLASGDLWLKLSRPFPGVTNLLANLKKKKIQVAIVSIRKNRGLIKQLLEKLGWQHQVNFLFCGDDIADSGGITTHASNALKLKRTGYFKAMKNLGVSREQTLVVGDDPDDLQAAFDLHVPCVRIRNSYKDLLFDVATKGIPIVETTADLRITE